MTHWNRLLACAASVAWGLTALAADIPTPTLAPPNLPPTELARRLIEQDAGVVEARRSLGAATYGAAALRASPYEWTTRVSAQQRRIDGGGNSNEWNAALERSIRIGGKAAIDHQLADTELLIAQARVGEARRDAARMLADLWVDALATRRQRELWAEQLGFAEASLKAVQTRRRAGDASGLDANVARADFIEVQRQLSAATTAEARAGAKLELRFPALNADRKPIGDPTPLGDPPPLDLDQPQWRARILAQSEPIRIAEGLRKKAELSAARARADRIPDPTVGVYTASEAFRNERIVGLSLSIPLSGSYRESRMQQALQEAEAAGAQVERLRRELDAEIADAYIEATGAAQRWRLASQGLSTTRDSARLTQRAYTLGEADLQTLLLARRQALDATTAAEQARVEALRWHHRLLIDAHLIWGLADE